ncbi:nucleotide exchange factor GrpE [Flavobacteriales bacterium]|nr:nucleotide exchange factor GrpE [Flavobacteriales bacterium]
MQEEKEALQNEELNEEVVEEQTEVINEEEVNTEDSFEDKFNELNDKYLRLFSEFDNFKRRTAKEKLELSKTASAAVLKDLLTVLDDFDRANESFEKATDVAALKEGVDLIYSKLFKTLESKGLKPMDSLHTEFNADIHEALTNIPAPEEELKGKVLDVIEKGYTLNDKIIRYAKVVVGN